MRNAACAWRKWIAALVLILSAAPLFSQSSFDLAWRKDRSVSASIEGKPLTNVLSRLAAVTGWKIYVQPGLQRQVSVEFKNISQGEALRNLLGGLNYALVPQPPGGARLYIYETSRSAATTLIRPEAAERAKNWIANELILSLAPGSKLDIDELAEELGGKVIAKAEGLNAYRIEFPDAETAEAAREKIAERDDLAYHDNYSFDRPTVAGGGTPSPEKLFPLDPAPVSRGDQITVALVDTPIQPLDGKMKDFVLPTIHIREEPLSSADGPTHATSMAQTLLNSMALERGGASDDLGKVRLQPIDIYGDSASTTTFEVAQGLHRAIQSGARVINLSLGGTGESPMVDYLLDMARQKEILVFASAGNVPTTDFTWPAANPNTIAVTAADWNGNIAPYANRGSFVDVKAPGTSRVYFGGQTYLSTGTSTATAYISGQAAALTARGLSVNQAAEAILSIFDVNATPTNRSRTR